MSIDIEEIRARAEAATPGPWEAYGTTIAAMTGPSDCGGCSGILSPAHEPSCYWSEIAMAGEPDAEFIAHARTDVPALLAENGELRDKVGNLNRLADEAIRRLSRHEAAVRSVYEFVPAIPGIHSDACRHCQRPWPCPTISALAQLHERDALDEHLEPILTERNRLRAAVEAVRALVDHYADADTIDQYGQTGQEARYSAAYAIRAVLDEHLGGDQ